MRRLLPVLAALLYAPIVLAEATVVEVRKDDFPYDQTVRVYVSKGELFLECRDEYLDKARKRVDVDGLTAGFNKLLEWMELNQTVKAKVTKRISLNNPSSKKIDWSEAKASFHGLESGGSFAFISTGENCTVRKYQIQKLLEGIDKNLESAREEDSKNKEDLFQ